MITILSYHPGLSGDFLAYNIHQDKKYFNINDLCIKTEFNRYLFPCLTTPVLGWEIKVENKNLTIEDIHKLNIYYKIDIVLPTHIYRHIKKHKKCKYVRLYTKNETTLKLSFVLWWIKSHIISEEPYLSRLIEIKNIPESLIKTELVTKFQKWKYLSYKLNFMNNGSFDLYYYIKNIYNFYIHHASLDNMKGFHNIDVYETIYNGNYKTIENIFEVEINNNLIKEYAHKNNELLNEIDIDINLENFLDQLALYIKKNINTIDLRECYDFQNGSVHSSFNTSGLVTRKELS
jgi:hypothetical protein